MAEWHGCEDRVSCTFFGDGNVEGELRGDFCAGKATKRGYEKAQVKKFKTEFRSYNSQIGRGGEAGEGKKGQRVHMRVTLGPGAIKEREVSPSKKEANRTKMKTSMMNPRMCLLG